MKTSRASTGSAVPEFGGGFGRAGAGGPEIAFMGVGSEPDPVDRRDVGRAGASPAVRRGGRRGSAAVRLRGGRGRPPSEPQDPGLTPAPMLLPHLGAVRVA